ncbi:MAG: RtcB family protein [Muribaculum sp.]
MQETIINNVTVKSWVTELDEHGRQEVYNLCRLPFVFHHIALMPDAHGGKGMPIGGVLATKNAVIPNAVGVDIGCGMCVVKTSVRVDELTPEILRKGILRGIRKQIPLGRDRHKTPQPEEYMPQGFDIDATTTVVARQINAARKQIGTLGGGNHFIELQRDDEGYLWIMIHSGSRNLGKQVGEFYNQKAEMLNRRWYSSVVSDLSLPFLPVKSDEFSQYWAEMEYCVEFALCNRRLIMHRIQEVIGDTIPDTRFEPMINIAHNYAAWENHFGENCIVHRKGATLATAGTVGIIPGSQGTCSYITEGLGNPESFMSCSHGAGRRLSRTEARNTLSLQDEIARLDSLGIVHAVRSKADLDESTGAYKDIDEVMAAQSDLVRIRTRLTPIAVIKG